MHGDDQRKRYGCARHRWSGTSPLSAVQPHVSPNRVETSLAVTYIGLMLAFLATLAMGEAMQNDYDEGHTVRPLVMGGGFLVALALIVFAVA